MDRPNQHRGEPRKLSNIGLPPPAVACGIETVLHRALIEGDDAALAEAMRRMRPLMSRVALDHTRSPDDADDLIQETWLAALHGIRRFRGRALLSTWLLRILSYRARTMSRRAARSMPLSQLGGDGEAWEAHSGPLFGHRPSHSDDAVRVKELREAVGAAVATLPPGQRDVFVLRDLDGESAADVCRQLGVSTGNQRVLLHRARSQVRRLLSGYWRPARRTPGGDSDAPGGHHIRIRALLVSPLGRSTVFNA